MAEIESSFEVLKGVDLSAHKEKKGKYDYISWAVALDILYTKFPGSSYEVHTSEEGHPFFKSELGYYVVVSVTVGEKVETEYHPVTDNSNQPKVKPSMVDINFAIKRGLVKAIAQQGLGLDIWIGEDLEQYDSKTVPVKKSVVKTSTAANDKTPEKEVELLDTWRGMVIAAQEKFGAGNYKAAVHQKLVELFGPSSEGDYSSSYQRSEPAVTADQVKEFLVSFEVPDLHLACKELLTEEKGNE